MRCRTTLFSVFRMKRKSLHNLIYLAMNNLKTLTLSLLSSAALLISQPLKSQDLEWFQPEHEWYFSVDCLTDPGCGYSHYSVGQDTLISGEQGTEVHVSVSEEGGALTVGSEVLRFSDDTVFRYSPEAGKWHLLYDLGASPGDVWNIQDEEFFGYAEEGAPDSLFRVVVDSVDVTEIGGAERRMIYTSAWTDGDLSSRFHFGYAGFILEGTGPVGDARGLTGQTLSTPLPAHPAEFRCFLSDGELVFGSDDAPCNLLNAPARTAPEPLLLHPNPTHDRLAFDLQPTEIASVRVTDTNGRTVMSETNLGESSIDTSGLPPGIYILEIFTRDGGHAAGKFVKSK